MPPPPPVDTRCGADPAGSARARQAAPAKAPATCQVQPAAAGPAACAPPAPAAAGSSSALFEVGMADARDALQQLTQQVQRQLAQQEQAAASAAGAGPPPQHAAAPAPPARASGAAPPPGQPPEARRSSGGGTDAGSSTARSRRHSYERLRVELPPGDPGDAPLRGQLPRRTPARRARCSRRWCPPRRQWIRGAAPIRLAPRARGKRRRRKPRRRARCSQPQRGPPHARPQRQRRRAARLRFLRWAWQTRGTRCSS